MTPMRLTLTSLAVLALAGGLSRRAGAADAIPTGPIHDRQEAMKGIGDAMKTLNAIAKKETPFDATIVGRKAWIVAEHLKTASALFPAGSAGESRAKPEIWIDGAAFEKGFKDGYAAAVVLQSVTDEPAFGPAQATLAVSCKNCHEQYRLPAKK
jgi:cytochrome c556